MGRVLNEPSVGNKPSGTGGASENLESSGESRCERYGQVPKEPSAGGACAEREGATRAQGAKAVAVARGWVSASPSAQREAGSEALKADAGA